MAPWLGATERTHRTERPITLSIFSPTKPKNPPAAHTIARVGWLGLIVVGAAGIASMKAALERGDLDEAARQGVLAGPAVVEAALGSADRSTRFAAITAAPQSEDRAELLVGLAKLAADPDRRAAIPAARAARTIARELAAHDPADDLADADVRGMRDSFSALALDRSRWIEVRVAALETAAALDQAVGRDLPGLIGVPLTVAFEDPDPAFRTAAITAVPMPVPIAARATLAAMITRDESPRVALTAAGALCADLAIDPAAPVLAALGADGIAKLRVLIKAKGSAPQLVRDANRCLKAAR